jgi:hypothetical protein
VFDDLMGHFVGVFEALDHGVPDGVIAALAPVAGENFRQAVNGVTDGSEDEGHGAT